MLPLLLALVAPTATAHDDTDDDEVSYEVIAVDGDEVIAVSGGEVIAVSGGEVIAVSDGDCDEVVIVEQEPSVEEPPRPHHRLRFQVAALQSERSPWLAGQFRLVGRKDAYLGVEGRISGDRSWVGRVGAGFDILGRSDWDLKLGLFLGGVGTGLRRDEALIVGTELGLGARIGPIYSTYRWLGGVSGRPELVVVHSEHEVILGFRIWDQLRVFGQATYSCLGEGYSARALGLGLQFRI